MQPEEVKTGIAEQAFDRYRHCYFEIERIRNSIRQNRKGQIPLTEITGSADKLARRVAREGLPMEQALERINGVPNFQDVFILEKIVQLSNTVCRITVSSSSGATGFGTGFLIAPNLMLTNHHVLPDADTARSSFAQFQYQLAQNRKAQVPVNVQLRPDRFFMTSSLERHPDDPYSGLDFSIIAVEETSEEGLPVASLGHARLDENLGKVLEGENCVVIQHPRGDFKKVVLLDIRMLSLVDDFLVYESDTLPGSSGSMVLGLGTGEVVALHHSGVPRRDEQGRWLRKDSTPVQPGDGDEVIDWLGNEGIRVSSIIRAIKHISLPPQMEPMRSQLLQNVRAEASLGPGLPHERNKKKEAAEAKPQNLVSDTAGLVQFEVELVDNDAFVANWQQEAGSLIPGLQTNIQLFPLATQAPQRLMYYLGIKTSLNPWQQAAAIEALPHVARCWPDLPVQTDVGLARQQSEVLAVTESAVKNALYNDGTAEWNEAAFLEQWKGSYCFTEWFQAPSEPELYRRWNWRVVGMPDEASRDVELWNTIKENLKRLRITQLDTGYSHHAKVRGAFDLIRDMDFIDADQDAQDEMAGGWGLKHPSHGTRTASIVVGGKMAPEVCKNDGNPGLLTEGGIPLVTVVPYRVAKSVVLIGRGKDMVDAAQHAINTRTDVLFMCMGSYPRPMIEQVAYNAYENGVIWVCAAGNEVEVVVAPALYPGTIAVAAINPDLKPWKGSSNGPAVDVAAPGESVYVPFVDTEGKELMCYGNGTSYATPHVAAAAMLWKAKNLEAIGTRYRQPWQVVEAFRWCLRKSAAASARKPKGWDEANYGAGILDIEGLLGYELPDASELTHAYQNKKLQPDWDLGVRETVHYFWNFFKRKTKPGVTESVFADAPLLTDRARMTIKAFQVADAGFSATESSAAPVSDATRKEVLVAYFQSFQ